MGQPLFWDRIAVRLWNFRFELARAILPGSHHHISVRDANEWCEKCEVVV